MRSKVYFTSALVNGSPLWKYALSTRSKVQVWGSVCVQAVARRGTNSPAVLRSISLLKMLS